jgi:hypothetical protein
MQPLTGQLQPLIIEDMLPFFIHRAKPSVLAFKRTVEHPFIVLCVAFAAAAFCCLSHEKDLWNKDEIITYILMMYCTCVVSL